MKRPLLPLMRRPTRIPDPGQMVDLQMEEGSWRQGFRALSAPSTAEMGEVLIWVCTEDSLVEAAKLGILGASLPRTSLNRGRRALSEVAELAALKPAQHLIEGVRADAYVALERVV